MINRRNLVLLITMATADLCGGALAIRAQTSGTFAPGQGCSDLVPLGVPTSGSFNCAHGFAAQGGVVPADDAFVIAAYFSSPTVAYGSLPDLGYQPGTDPDVGVDIMQVTSTKFHDFQMYRNQISMAATITPPVTSMSNDVETVGFAQCWFTVDDPTQPPDADIVLNYDLGLSAQLGTPPAGSGRVSYFAEFAVDDVSGPMPQSVASWGGFIAKFAGFADPLISGFDPADVSCAGDSCTVAATVAESMIVPNGALIVITSSVLGSISLFNSPGLWELDSNNTSVFAVTVDEVANPNATLILAATGVPGDYNGDGVVDAADYTVYRDHLGQMFTLTNENPDAATQGLVDQEDYDFWVANFGMTAGSGSLSNSAVPEPASAWLLVVGGLLPILLRTRSHCT